MRKIFNFQFSIFNSKGFTLLEIMISVGILATIGVLITQVLFTTMHANTKSTLLSDIKQNGDFALDVMSREIRAAAENTTPCAVSQESAGTLTLQTSDNDTVTFSCSSDGTAARITMDSASGTQYLTGTGVTLSTTGGATCADSSLSFSCPAAVGVPGPVKIQFSLGQLGADPNTYAAARTSFQTTVSLRN